MVLPSATTDIAGRGPSVGKLGTGSKTERKELCSNSNCRCLLLVRPHQDGTPFSPGQGSPPRPHVGHPCDAPRLSAHSPGCLLTPADQAAARGAALRNTTLRELSLARNLIGQDELNNTLNDDIVTGGEAIADMLRTNKALTHLDLSFNGFDAIGTGVVATIIRTAPVLALLNLSGAILAGSYDDDGVWQDREIKFDQPS